MTEDKDILARELEEDRCWVNEQHALMLQVEQLSAEKEKLEEKKKFQEEELAKYKANHGKGRCRKMDQMKEEQPKPLTIITDKDSISKFFKNCV